MVDVVLNEPRTTPPEEMAATHGGDCCWPLRCPSPMRPVLHMVVVSCMTCVYGDGRRRGGSYVRRGLRARAHDDIGHEPGMMSIGLLGTKAPSVAVVLLLATVQGSWWRRRC
ncbi:hypothetical protein Dimus_026533 [Dionaea muscipula]